MQIENEVKYSIKNIDEIKKKIESLGFNFIKKTYQKDYYFSPPHKNFAGTKKYYLRLRNAENKAEFAYHVVKNNLKTKEWSVFVNHFEDLLKILNLLDFKIDCIVGKERLIYKKDNIKIMLDSVKNLGKFIEIECMGQFGKSERKKFGELINLLKLKKTQGVSGMGYPDLLMSKTHDKI